MLWYESINDDPAFNLATEEYLLKNSDEDIFMLYSNSNSVIVGKHQNALAEINYMYIRENNIPVMRRITGGGTVFHDKGNLNFSLILNGKEGKLIDFRKYTAPVIEFLSILGLKAEFAGHNSILVGDKKVSGNAEHIFRKRLIHHGTLLFNTDLALLRNTILNDRSRYSDKAVLSVSGKVANISDLLDNEIGFKVFRDKFREFILNKYSITVSLHPADKDIQAIHDLANDKYKQWDWSYGYSPDYEFTTDIEMNPGKIKVNLIVKRGMVHAFSIDPVYQNVFNKIANSLTGRRHNYEDFNEALLPFGKIINHTFEDFIYQLF